MLYLHIPFCKQACSYCNFHFSTSMKTRPAVLSAMHRELRIRRRELPAGPVKSVYFGGGTPSLLTESELTAFFDVLAGEYAGATLTEVNSQETTLEANPDDLDDRTVATLAASPVNRLSIGIQSFFSEDLAFMNRAHTAAESRSALDKVRRAGFQDVSIDLIYGGQTTTDEMWAENLRIATDLGVTHISAYALTVEPRTALGKKVASGKVAMTDDARFERHFEMLVEHLTRHGYRHYEVSNFCLPGHESVHNSGYWSGQAYLGVGPGAHSFDGKATRRWNVENNATYAKAWAEVATYQDYLSREEILFGREELSRWDRYNEYVMTSLRREEGLSLDGLRERFGPEAVPYFSRSQAGNVDAGYFHAGVDGGHYRLNRAGLMRADGIAGDGFFVEN